ncbi:hypothetical protein PRUPE_2G076100 [Prunus persica]|uniref:Uncharacterized protein n=1 Tax=Prunus persica TaxID=3760 RepID=A0A251QCX1_PRUPE|nr:hypothetical protein PRUPE_2G076100 [Prunus persica]
MEMERKGFTSSTSTTVIVEAPGERAEQALKQDGSPNEAVKLLKEKHEKEFGGSGKRTEQELPQNKKSEAANTNGTNDKPVSIHRNPVKKATNSHHVGVFECNNRAQGTGCDIEDNEVNAEDSEFVGVFNCGNEPKKPN